MLKTIRPILVIAFLLAFNLVDRAQEPSSTENTVFQTFSMWGTTPAQTDRIFLYAGFTNGFFSAPSTDTGKKRLAGCIVKNIPPKQAIAMIDKYYKDNPQRWSTLFAMGIIEALTVKDGPCPGIDPWTK